MPNVAATGFRLFLLVALLLPAAARAAEARLVRVWPGYREAESFVSIGEYFGGDEAKGRRVIVRTQPDERGGYYWLIRLKLSAPVEQARIELAVIRAGEPEPVVHPFATPLPAGNRVVLVGLTGRDWTDANERPVAWRLRIMDAADGSELITEQSFLWGPAPVDE